MDEDEPDPLDDDEVQRLLGEYRDARAEEEDAASRASSIKDELESRGLSDGDIEHA